jgi:hypothetical protein
MLFAMVGLLSLLLNLQLLMNIMYLALLMLLIFIAMATVNQSLMHHLKKKAY